jgi:hypothetical protein
MTAVEGEQQIAEGGEQGAVLKLKSWEQSLTKLDADSASTHVGFVCC